MLIVSRHHAWVRVAKMNSSNCVVDDDIASSGLLQVTMSRKVKNCVVVIVVSGRKLTGE